MAIATLADVYNNPKVFAGVVKIRKGMAAKLILDTKSTEGLHKWFNTMSRDILARVPTSDPSAPRTREICSQIIALTDKHARVARFQGWTQSLNVLALLVVFARVVSQLYVKGSGVGSGGLDVLDKPVGRAVLMGSLGYLVWYRFANSARKSTLRKAYK